MAQHLAERKSIVSHEITVTDFASATRSKIVYRTDRERTQVANLEGQVAS
jgi:uncharacterized NAD-dependent epimerase/dehydratase family protein